MKVVIQKSGQAKVKINGKTHSEIEEGLVILLGIKTGDTEKEIDYLVEKIINLRLLDEGEKHFEKYECELNPTRYPTYEILCSPFKSILAAFLNLINLINSFGTCPDIAFNFLCMASVASKSSGTPSDTSAV